MMDSKLPCLTLNRHAERRLAALHPWVFSNEIHETERLQRLEPGTVVDVLDCHGNYAGTGFVNPKSLIAVRILHRERGLPVDARFFAVRIASAVRHREAFYGRDGCYRAVFGESDGLPGLILDRFGSVLVAEPHAFGMHRMRDLILEGIREALGDLAVVWRTENRGAKLEGIDPRSELVAGELPSGGVWAVEDGVKIPVDVMHGQKTGFFFDQRENRTALCRWVAGAARGGSVLDLYCHLGAWGLRALAAGAGKVTFVDQSREALDGARESARILGREKDCEFFEGDALQVMKDQSRRSFDAVVVDPPAFITSKKTAAQGLKAYAVTNKAAASLVADGGVLSTSSCSFHLEEPRFEGIVAQACWASGRAPRVLRRAAAAFDHPELAGVIETGYLKNLLVGF
ncbi:MAG: class I SAM-dependent rRNA methyltransferase [Bdellovibrionales bacterium]|nr:class I SAM-dependent rRNA methyltransferase [Bdellovibrionales bacterium]